MSIKKLNVIHFPKSPLLLSRDLFLNGTWKVGEQQHPDVNPTSIKFLIFNTILNTSNTLLSFFSHKNVGHEINQTKAKETKACFACHPLLLVLCLYHSLWSRGEQGQCLWVYCMPFWASFCFAFTNFFRGMNPMGCQGNWHFCLKNLLALK